jgi:hypothetical protein
MSLRRSFLFMFCALALAVLVACGDGDNDGPSEGEQAVADFRATVQQAARTAAASGTAANAPRATRTPVPQAELSGDYDVTFRFQQRPADEDLRDALEMPEDLDVVLGEGIIAISGNPPFIEVAGTITAEGAISATGNGSLDEDYNDIAATFEGTLVSVRLTGTYTLTGESLPGGTIVFDVEGEFDD